MNALIVEDEMMARAKLEATLAANFPDIRVIGATSSVADTVRFLREAGSGVDVIFMDVELGDGDCFEIFRQEKVTARVIMTTAYDSYAIKAFEAGSIDYLLKPIELRDLQRAIDRCREREKGIDVQKLLEAFATKDKPKWKERFILRLGDSIIPIPAAQAACFFSEDKSNYLVTFQGTKYIIDETMEELEAELDPEVFFRCSRGAIVNRDNITSVTRLITGKLRLVTKSELPYDLSVARARVDDFLKWLE